MCESAVVLIQPSKADHKESGSGKRVTTIGRQQARLEAERVCMQKTRRQERSCPMEAEANLTCLEQNVSRTGLSRCREALTAPGATMT